MFSSLVAQLAESLTAEEARTGDALDALEWAYQYRRIDDRPFSLEKHQPLKQIYADDHPHIVIIKPAQVGCSELAITRVVHALDVGSHYWETGKAGLNVGYLFPTKDALEAFSKERFSGLKHESEHLTKLFSGYDGTDFKQAGQSYLYLRGMNSESGLLSFPADVLIYDEFDRMPPGRISMAEKRLRASTIRRQIKLSTPTLPGQGIHAEYLRSDQRVWEVQCPHCNDWNDLDFFRDVRADGLPYDEWRFWTGEQLKVASMTVACPSCQGDIDRCGPGRWTARNPDVTTVRGYHVPSLCFGNIDLHYLAARAIKTDPTEVEEFYRSDLGFPHEAGGSRVTLAMLQQLSSELEGGELPEGTWTRTVMGVDVGARFHYRIDSTGPDGARYVRAMGAVRSWDELDKLITQYKVRLTVIDAAPEWNGCKTWSQKHKGKVLRATYPNGLVGQLFHKHDEDADIEDDKKDIVQINRTMAMDAVYDRVAQGDDHWPVSIHANTEVKAHMCAPVRVKDKDKNGQEIVHWVHTAPDHLYHASVYALIAFQALPKKLAGNPLAQGKAKGW